MTSKISIIVLYIFSISLILRVLLQPILLFIWRPLKSFGGQLRVLIGLEDGSILVEISCDIKGITIIFTENDINKALDLPTENFDAEASNVRMVEFLEFIRYRSGINLSQLNKKYVRKKWSLMFDALQKAILCRKTGWYQIVHVFVKMAYALPHNMKINVKAINMKELSQRLGKSPRSRGSEIFYPKFI